MGERKKNDGERGEEQRGNWKKERREKRIKNMGKRE